MKYVQFKEYNSLDEFYDGYNTEYFYPLYVILNNIIVFIYKKSRI